MKRTKLQQIELCGFKSYGLSQKIDLKDINVLIGANGSGKSNFISFLEMVSYLSTDGFIEYVRRNGYSKSMLYNNGKGINGGIQGRFNFSNNENIEYTLSFYGSTAGFIFVKEEGFKYKSKTDPESHEQKIKSDYEFQSGLIELAKKDDKAKEVLRLLQGCRIFHFNDTSITSEMRTPSYVNDNAALRANGANIAAYLLRLRKAPDYQDYYERIIRTIREVFPIFDDFVLSPDKPSGSNSNVILDWREKGNDEIFGPHVLSDGTIRFMALATLLLQPEELIPGVIILDEPEIGLHPYAIRVLGRMIRRASKYSQLIISTQSTAMLNEFDYKDILVTEYNQEKRSSIIRRLDEEHLRVWLDDYSLGELWDKNILGGNPD